MKQFGEKMVGRGPEVRVRNDIDDYQHRTGARREQAEKIVFQDRISLVLGELGIKD